MRCSSTLPADLVLAIVGSGSAYPIGCLPSSMRDGRFVAIGAVELFWIGTAWPNGASTIVFVATVLLLLSPRGDLAYDGAIAFTVGNRRCRPLRGDDQICRAPGPPDLPGPG